MATKILIQFILMLSLTAMGAKVFFQDLKCNVNPDLCTQNICQLRKVRNKITLLDFSCFYEQPISSMDSYVTLYRKSGNTFQRFLVEAHDDLCNVFSYSTRSQIMARIFQPLSKYGLNMRKCPITGNVSIVNYPLDLSFMPSIINGDFRADVTASDLIRKAHLINISAWFAVRNM